MQIDDLMDAKYEVGGRGPFKYDCFGLFRELCARRGLAIPDELSPIVEMDRQARIFEAVKERWVKLDKPEPGCAVAIRIGPWVSHLGMVLDDANYFMHANDGPGIAIERLDDPKWVKRIAGFYRYE